MSKFLLRRYLFVPRVFSPFPISALENHFEQSCLVARYTFSELLFNCFSYTLSTNTRISIANSLLMTYNIANIRFHRSKRKKDLRNGIYVLLSWNKWRPIYSTTVLDCDRAVSTTNPGNFTHGIRLVCATVPTECLASDSQTCPPFYHHDSVKLN